MAQQPLPRTPFRLFPSLFRIWIQDGARLVKVRSIARQNTPALQAKFSQLKVLGEYIPYTNANVLIGSQIGGWLMLGIVFAGITALGVTHFLGMQNMRRPRRRQLSRILWVEALTKSKLARFVWPNWHSAKGKNWKNFKAFRRGRDPKNVLMAIWSGERPITDHNK